MTEIRFVISSRFFISSIKIRPSDRTIFATILYSLTVISALGNYPTATCYVNSLCFAILFLYISFFVTKQISSLGEQHFNFRYCRRNPIAQWIAQNSIVIIDEQQCHYRSIAPDS